MNGQPLTLALSRRRGNRFGDFRVLRRPERNALNPESLKLTKAIIAEVFQVEVSRKTPRSAPSPRRGNRFGIFESYSGLNVTL
jgi:hypothetical protein